MADRITYRLIVTVYSDKQHFPITIGVGLNDYQAQVLMATPVKKVGLAIERAGGILIDKLSEPVDFK